MGGARQVRRLWRALSSCLQLARASKPTRGQNDVDLYAKRTARDRMAGICGRRPLDPRHWACRCPRPGARRLRAQKAINRARMRFGGALWRFAAPTCLRLPTALTPTVEGLRGRPGFACQQDSIPRHSLALFWSPAAAAAGLQAWQNLNLPSAALASPVVTTFQGLPRLAVWRLRQMVKAQPTPVPHALSRQAIPASGWRIGTAVTISPCGKPNQLLELRGMSELVVLDFDGIGTADEVLTKLRAMQKEHLIDLEDACVVVHTDKGKVQIKQALNLTAFGAARGASAGMLVGALTGLLLLNPLAGMAVGGLTGMGVGALSGSLTDYGINDEFIKDLGKTIPKGSSALFMLIKRSTPDKVLPELERFKPRVLKTSLSNKQEESLRSALRTAQTAA